MSPFDLPRQREQRQRAQERLYCGLESHRVRHWSAATRLHAYLRPDRDKTDPELWAPWASGFFCGPLLVFSAFLAVCWWNGGTEGMQLQAWAMAGGLAIIVGSVSMDRVDRWAARHTAEQATNAHVRFLLDAVQQDARLQHVLERFLAETEGAYLARPEAKVLIDAHHALAALRHEEGTAQACVSEQAALLDGAGGLREKALARQRADALARQLPAAGIDRPRARV